jgi:predicted lactoylglutathione lyase
MASTATGSRQIFVNLPVRDLKRSIAFFRTLRYEFDPRFTDQNAACMIVSDDIFVMLLAAPFFRTFTPKNIADTTSSAEVLVSLSAPTRAEVDRVVHSALRAGGRPTGRPREQGFMYEWGFEDLDGHTWEFFWMDPAHLERPAKSNVAVSSMLTDQPPAP